MAASPQIEAATGAKSHVALTSMLAAAGVTLLKLLVAVLTRSLGMFSEAAHSGLDLVAATLTLLSVRLSGRPADETHSYGHGKFENVSASVQIFLMLLSAGWIVREAVHRIVEHTGALRLTWWPFAVLMLSIAVDIGRSRALSRAARRFGSPALAADAAHFQTDIYTGLGVMVGLALVYAGRLLHIPWLSYADSVAALLVAVIICFSAWRLARPTLDQLTDAVPEAERQRVVEQLRFVPGVLSVDRVRLRRSGSGYFADLTLGMPRTLTFQRAEQLTESATEAVQRVLPGCDVVVHTVPRQGRDESVFDRIRAVAQRHNVAVHDLVVREDDNGLTAEQHLEVPEAMTLRQAHDFVTRLEADIRQDCPEVASVLTHIESEPSIVRPGGPVTLTRPLEALLRDSASQAREILDVHDIHARRLDDHVQLSCHCTLLDDLSMGRVHDIITQVEARVRVAAPEVSRVLIHPEPLTDNQR